MPPCNWGQGRKEGGKPNYISRSRYIPHQCTFFGTHPLACNPAPQQQEGGERSVGMEAQSSPGIFILFPPPFSSFPPVPQKKRSRCRRVGKKSPTKMNSLSHFPYFAVKFQSFVQKGVESMVNPLHGLLGLLVREGEPANWRGRSSLSLGHHTHGKRG